MIARWFVWWVLMVGGFVLTALAPSLLVGQVMLLVGSAFIVGPIVLLLIIAFISAIYIGVLAGGKTFMLVIKTFVNALSNPAQVKTLLEEQKRIKANDVDW